ncbi:hypothetical protein [Pseudonocardia abyssalis]|uniref:Uncharacterized protein n=1 Tax=Pseudonocardia abyssalis TaxID=2792008 RepID=A0ABS6UQK7_9PSEU|nr:hypothetical protein [Pseudonocardia abyssalis]MBW0115792.1 hypothetical protein [Pseudonocardia abyssalis]MBW0134529.1 hypothetical protein [Pseudonocardia abyssalis]
MQVIGAEQVGDPVDDQVDRDLPAGETGVRRPDVGEGLLDRRDDLLGLPPRPSVVPVMRVGAIALSAS